MSVVSQSVKSLRRVRIRPRAPGATADDGRGKTGQRPCQQHHQKQTANFTPAPEMQQQDKAKSDGQQRQPVADFAQIGGELIRRSLRIQPQKIIHVAVQRKGS